MNLAAIAPDCRGMHTRTRYNESGRYQRRKEEFMLRNKVK
jgi:hypothetical protein